MRGTRRKRCAATYDPILAAMLVIVIALFLAGLLFFAAELTDLFRGDD